MLRISCPCCGVRDQEEFVFGGPAHLSRPRQESSDVIWAAYLYLRDNPRGAHRERWCHRYGCGQWFNLVRHTVTHVIEGSCSMGAGQ